MLYTSVARADVSPNSPNIVPESAVLFAKLRAPEPNMLTWSKAQLRAALPDLAAKAQVEAEIVAVDRRPAGKFDPRLIALSQAQLMILAMRKCNLIRLQAMMLWMSMRCCRAGDCSAIGEWGHSPQW